MEQRLIDANALEKKILKRGAYKICTDDVVAMIADAPTVDAVQVVRCAECKHHEDEEPGIMYCRHIVGSWVTEDFYCAYGERRSDD